MQTLHVLLLVGSLGFGLEALLLGLGGRLSVLYRRRKFRTLGLASAIGFAIAGLAILTSPALGQEALHTCVLALIYTVVLGKAIGVLKPKLREPVGFPPPAEPSEEELRAMLRKRGFGKLAGKRKKR